MTLEDIEERFVSAFDGESRFHRDLLFRGLEQAVQDLLNVRIPCWIFLDGSFLTEKPKPDDVDVVIALDADLENLISEEQRQVIDLLNSSHDYHGLDSFAYFNYPRGHELFECGIDANAAASDYGVEHGGYHLKGYVVLRLMETDVGLRIHR
jgi:hypothetical protein